MALEKLDVYMPILILVAFAILLVVGALLVGKVLRPNKPNDRKKQAYECGEDPIGNAWSLFNMRFYVVGLIFIIFDVESALMFPVVAVFKKMNEIGRGGLVLAEIVIFLFVLIAGVAYCWRK